MAAEQVEKKKKKRKSLPADEAAAQPAGAAPAATPKSDKKKTKKAKLAETPAADGQPAAAEEPATAAAEQKVAEPSTAPASTTAATPVVAPVPLFRAERPHVSIIAVPLADDKLQKKVLKLAKKAAQKKQIKRGVKEVIKAVRKKQKGMCIIAGDISPVDVITPLPVLCEDNDIPYIYVPSKEELGAAGLTKRPTSCMLVLPKPLKGGEADEDFDTTYDAVFAKIKAVQPAF